MKIYCQYAGQKTLAPTKGDFVTEINMYTALSKFAEVYYSGVRFEPRKPDYGLINYPESIETRMPQDCDVYYIRGSEAAFRAAPVGKPRLWVCSPWNGYCFREATVIGTLTRAWERALRKGRKIPVLNPEGFQTDNVITIGQVVSDSFQPFQRRSRTRKIRQEIGGKFIIGIFGRVVESNYPHAFLEVNKWLAAKYPRVRVVVGVTRGEFPKNLPNVVYRHFSNVDMPYATSACDLIMIPGKGFTWPIRGCMRALEAGACGVPVLLCRSAAREEHLGDDYPLFLRPMHPTKSTPEDVRELKQKLRWTLKNKMLRKRLAVELPTRTTRFTVAGAAHGLKRTFRKIANWEKT